MNAMSLYLSRNPLYYCRLLSCVPNATHIYANFINLNYTTTVDAMDLFTKEFLHGQKCRVRSSPVEVNNFSIRNFVDGEKEQKNIGSMTNEELDKIFIQLMTKNKDNKLVELLKYCTVCHRHVHDSTLKSLYRHFSVHGKTDIVEVLQSYCLKVDPYSYRRNAGFMHYLAKAQCMKGNSEKGLSILNKCYQQNESLRSMYRIIFRELIQDSVMNRSEASLVTFKKYVLKFSETFNEHYPLICFWHMCWSSTWFSDQMLSNELLESSGKLQEIVKERATAFSITILRQEYNEDSVVRLLQTLLKYEQIEEYARVLQVLFSFKLKNRDLRGCTEIIRNCETLGITLPSDQQGRYIKMLITGDSSTENKPTKPTLKNFKLKF